MWNRSSGSVSPEPGTGTASASVTCARAAERMMSTVNLFLTMLLLMMAMLAIDRLLLHAGKGKREEQKATFSNES